MTPSKVEHALRTIARDLPGATITIDDLTFTPGRLIAALAEHGSVEAIKAQAVKPVEYGIREPTIVPGGYFGF